MAAAAQTMTRPIPIAADRSGRLFRWNLVLAGLHFVQFVAILAISFARDSLVSAPVTSSYLAWDPATRTLTDAQRSRFDLPFFGVPPSSSNVGGQTGLIVMRGGGFEPAPLGQRAIARILRPRQPGG